MPRTKAGATGSIGLISQSDGQVTPTNRGLNRQTASTSLDLSWHLMANRRASTSSKRWPIMLLKLRTASAWTVFQPMMNTRMWE